MRLKKFKKKPKRTECYHAFVDGSWFAPDRAGAGGLIYSSNNYNSLKDFSKKLPAGQTSMTAEIYAAAEALKRVPKHSLVILYSDCQDITRRVKERALHIPLYSKKDNIIQAYKALFNAMDVHKHVIVRHTRSNETPLMLAAHQLAQIGALQQPQPYASQNRSLKLVFPEKHKKKPLPARQTREKQDIASSFEAYGFAYNH